MKQTSHNVDIFHSSTACFVSQYIRAQVAAMQPVCAWKWQTLSQSFVGEILLETAELRSVTSKNTINGPHGTRKRSFAMQSYKTCLAVTWSDDDMTSFGDKNSTFSSQ